MEIDSILYSDKYCGRVFKGTHAIDALTSFEPGCYVVNLAPSNHPGLHWVAVFSLSGRDDVEYFDSAGQRAPPQLVQWWQSNFIQNPCVLQGPTTDVCGQYTIYYLTHRSWGRSMKSILSSFTSNTYHNDLIVYDFVNTNFRS